MDILTFYVLPFVLSIVCASLLLFLLSSSSFFVHRLAEWYMLKAVVLRHLLPSLLPVFSPKIMPL